MYTLRPTCVRSAMLLHKRVAAKSYVLPRVMGTLKVPLLVARARCGSGGICVGRVGLEPTACRIMSPPL